MISGTLSVTLCQVCAKEIVICANVAWRKASVVNGLITDYVSNIAFTLRLSSLSLSGTHKIKESLTCAP